MTSWMGKTSGRAAARTPAVMSRLSPGRKKPKKRPDLGEDDGGQADQPDGQQELLEIDSGQHRLGDPAGREAGVGDDTRR